MNKHKGKHLQLVRRIRESEINPPEGCYAQTHYF